MFSPKIISCLKNYSKQQFSSDIMAGVIVGVVAIPLAIVFGIASGVGPTEGLVSAIIAGFVISLLGGSKVQIGGPTGALVVVVYGIMLEYGAVGLMIATVMAGVIQIIMGFAKLGSVIKFVPYPVVIGFTGGIALSIFSTQMNDFFGLGITNVPADFISKWSSYISSFTNISLETLVVSMVSLLIIVFTPKISKKIPGFVSVIVIVTLAVWGLNTFGLFTSVSTIGDRYDLPSGFPLPSLPALHLKEGQTLWSTIQILFPAAFSIAMLGSIVSLLSAMVADGRIGERHDANTELIAQGIANVIVPFFGGIPVTGAVARTMTNINNGGRTPIAGVVHAVILLLVLLFLCPLVVYIPMSCLAAILVVVSYNMSGWRTFVSLYKGPKSDFIVLIVTFSLSVIFNLTVAIQIGLLLALVLFLKRVSESVNIRQFKDKIDPSSESDILMENEGLIIPEGVDVYEIEGPYFFGIANKFEEVMDRTSNKPKVRIIRMRHVPFMDSSGINNLETLCLSAKKDNVIIVLSGVNNDVRRELDKTKLTNVIGEENIYSSINEALERARYILEQS